MSKVMLSESYLDDIADAIRAKTGTQDTYTPGEMPEAIESISGGGITPEGTISITSNGTVDVTQYASADVNVPSVTPTGTINITQNGTTDVTNYATANVNVPNPSTGTKQISITQNGTTTEDVTQYASAEIAVNVNIANAIAEGEPTGEIEITSQSVAAYAFYQRGNVTEIRIPNSCTFGRDAFGACANLETFFAPLSNATDYFLNDNKKLTTAVVGSMNNKAQCIRGCIILDTLDINGSGSIANQAFSNDAQLNTIILRSSTLVALANTGAFSNTPFASGKAGGTIYIPKSLYDHLGDGTANDYQSATNWSTIYGYGTITWAKIEGSQYEGYYADGTAIPTT